MENNTTRENPQAQRPKAQDVSSIGAIKNEMESIRQKITEAKQLMPFKPNLRIVDAGELLDCVSRLSTGLGKAFAKAEGIVAQESQILREAREAANKMADQAEEQVNQAQEEKARILREAEEQRSAILANAQQEYDARIAKAEQDAQIMVSREEIVKRAEEAVRRASVDREEIILDTQKRAQQIIDEAHKNADAIYKQATEQADKAISSAVAAVQSYSNAFDNDANRLVETLRSAQVLVELLNESGERLGGFAKDMAERRDRMLHPEYFEE